MSKEYYLYVHNTMTGKTEKVEVTKEVYEIYTRTSWAIKNNDKSFYLHEIQFSSLIGCYENFSEFIFCDDCSEYIANKLIFEEIICYLKMCSRLEIEIFKLSFIDELTERKIAQVLQIPKSTVHDIKHKLITKIKKHLKY